MGATGPPASPAAVRRPAHPVSPATSAAGARRRPAAALRPHIVNYTGFRTRFPAPRHRLELPTGYVTLVFSFGEGLWVTRTGGPAATRLRPASGAMLSGPRTGAALGVHAGAVHGLEVNMSPLGAYRLFGIPVAQFEDAHVDLAEVLGPAGRHLTERLHSLGSWEARFRLLDDLFTARLERGPTASPEVRAALTRLWEDSGSLARATAETGWSARHLRARFREQVGLSPKGVARVFRLQHALRLLAAGTAPARVAAACGYHDQAHLGREVKALTGLAPSRFTALRAGLPPGSVLDRVPGRITSVLLSG
ncbi:MULTISPECIES: AraC family transcriptional regulator [unclassified Streptomyces]|uniref:helix-turn-helix domain-containing protein n=1 Tax=unclassified Streptomyces TaxID=2593676 RepID=UPI00225A07D6|nr:MULTISPECIES: helix-turn-helix transcriptional regulator [unclassified Streptomyces]MCX4525630.1 helix-turn-helix transcriptional regulator [Streptomyces sp. NBC_01551]MCX4543898.1 helix-turn-helix transcriptional regulator [Streptomyces sp. NBC_01565]